MVLRVPCWPSSSMPTSAKTISSKTRAQRASQTPKRSVKLCACRWWPPPPKWSDSTIPLKLSSKSCATSDKPLSDKLRCFQECSDEHQTPLQAHCCSAQNTIGRNGGRKSVSQRSRRLQ